MSYEEQAKLEVLNAMRIIKSPKELDEFKNVIVRYMAQKAQADIDALWDSGVINERTLETWSHEHMRTPYRHATNRL